MGQCEEILLLAERARRTLSPVQGPLVGYGLDLRGHACLGDTERLTAVAEQFVVAARREGWATDLVAGGRFSVVDGKFIPGIAKFDGVSWKGLGPGGPPHDAPVEHGCEQQAEDAHYGLSDVQLVHGSHQLLSSRGAAL